MLNGKEGVLKRIRAPREGQEEMRSRTITERDASATQHFAPFCFFSPTMLPVPPSVSLPLFPVPFPLSHFRSLVPLLVRLPCSVSLSPLFHQSAPLVPSVRLPCSISPSSSPLLFSALVPSVVFLVPSVRSPCSHFRFSPLLLVSLPLFPAFYSLACFPIDQLSVYPCCS